MELTACMAIVMYHRVCGFNHLSHPSALHLRRPIQIVKLKFKGENICMMMMRSGVCGKKPVIKWREVKKPGIKSREVEMGTSNVHILACANNFITTFISHTSKTHYPSQQSKVHSGRSFLKTLLKEKYVCMNQHIVTTYGPRTSGFGLFRGPNDCNIGCCS